MGFWHSVRREVYGALVIPILSWWISSKRGQNRVFLGIHLSVRASVRASGLPGVVLNLSRGGVDKTEIRYVFFSDFIKSFKHTRFWCQKKKILDVAYIDVPKNNKNSIKNDSMWPLEGREYRRATPFSPHPSRIPGGLWFYVSDKLTPSIRHCYDIYTQPPITQEKANDICKHIAGRSATVDNPSNFEYNIT